jgi:tetratricopeptide (TPR) repeat protein
VLTLTLTLALCAPGLARAGEAEDRLAAVRDAFARVHGVRQLAPLLEVVGPGAAGGLALDDELADGGAALIALVAEIADRAQDPLVQARARWELARLDDRRGRYAEAAKLRDALGLVGEEGLVVGPFANDAGAQLDAKSALPPEPALLTAPLDPAATWPQGADRGGLARVRPLPRPEAAGLARGARLAGGVIPLGALLRPETHVAAYLVFTVRSDAARTAALRLGSTGATVVWLNGRRLGDRKGDRALALDADTWAAPLVVGDNRFVVRVAVGDRQPELILRLTDPDGRSLGTSARGGGGPVRSLRAALEAEARRDPAAALDRDAWILRDGVDGPNPEAACADRGPERTARSARELELQLLCAPDGDVRRQVLEARLTAAPPPAERIALLTRLGELGLRGRTSQRGEEHLRQAIALGDPAATWRARLRLAELDADRGLATLAWRAVGAIEAVVPARRVREALAQLASRSGRRDEAERRYAALSAELPGDLALLRQLASLERGRATAEAMQRAFARLDAPRDLRDLESVALERVELEEGLGRSEAALARLRALVALFPDDARLEERLGKALLDRVDGRDGAGARTEAIAHLEASLRLRPQSPELRALLAEIDPDRSGGADLWRRWRVDPLALRQRAARDPLGRGDPARVLYDGATIHVHDNGLEETLVERVIEIGDRRGAEQQGEVDVRYAPDSQTVEVRVARVYKASGEVVDAASIEERDLSEPWAGLFYDVRAQVIGLPGLEPGDVVHVAYTVSDHGRRNELGDSFCDLRMLQEELVRLESVYRLIAPKRRTIHFNAPRLAGAAAPLPVQTTEEGGERRYEVVAREIAKIQPEPLMPGGTELGGYVHASTFADWGEVARFYRTLIAPQLEPDSDIRRAAREAVRGKKTDEEKVAAIYDLVVRSTRYVGLEFGVHGYQPYRVAQVYARRFGDCKDKASLLVAMLREIGIDASLILLRTRREGAVEPQPASLAPFDHAIAYVPALHRYLDGTAEFSGARELPGDDQGVAVLHVDEGVLRQTPIDGPTGARLENELDLRLHRDGSAEGEDHRRVGGAVAAAWRQHYQSPGERRERLEKSWSQRSPGAEVLSIELPALADRERPVELRAKLRLPRAAREEPGGLALPILLREPQLLGAFGRLSSRRHALELPEAFTEIERVRVRLPPGARARVPGVVRIESRFGAFTLEATPAPRGDEVRLEARTILNTRRVAPADYAAFRSFLADIDRAVGGELRIEAGR